MKKQDKNPIDQFFKENTEQHFPYDPALWKKADKGIVALFMKKRLLILSLILLVFISSMAVYMAYQPAASNEEISLNRNAGNKVSANENTSNESNANEENGEVKPDVSNSINGTNSENNNPPENTSAKTAPVSSGQKTGKSDDNNKPSTANGPEKPVVNKDSKVPSNSGDGDDKPGKDNNSKSPTKQSDIADKGSSEDKPDKNKKVPTPVASKSDPVKSPLKDEKTESDIFTMLGKPFYSFAFDISNKKPEAILKYLPEKKRKFTSTIEFENLNSILLKHKLSQLPEEVLAYRNKYETVKNAHSFSINVMLQRNGFGVVTGIGHSSAAIKTDYMTLGPHYEITQRYFMIRDSIQRPACKGYYSEIREVEDTVISGSEQQRIEGQASQNVFKWLQVPLKFSYQYPYKRLRFSLRAGADFMWLYNVGGSFISSQFNDTNHLDGLFLVKATEQEHKLKRLSVGGSVQIMAGYQFNRGLQVGGSFYYGQQFGSNFANYNSRFSNMGFGWYARFSLQGPRRLKMER